MGCLKLQTDVRGKPVYWKVSAGQTDFFWESTQMWLSVDPMADKYPHISPYTYCANNPIKLVDPNGMEFVDAPYLLFNGATNTLEIWEDGDTPDDTSDDMLLSKHSAHNQVASNSNGKWEDGVYEMQDKNTPHTHPDQYEKDGVTPKDSPNGAYGTEGIYRAKSFKETTTKKTRTGMGVHAGRENKSFLNRKTMGCIRTTPEAMEAIANAISNYGDLTNIIVKDNRSSGNSMQTNRIIPGVPSIPAFSKTHPSFNERIFKLFY